MKHHPGQVSFPGGKVEKDDLSAESAALREAHEEVGIDPESVEIIGKLSDLFVEVSGFSIQPFVAWIDQQPHFQINRTEVEKLIILPISDLVAQEEIFEKSLVMASGEIFIKYYPFGNEIIWGATAMIMAELIDILRQA
jgi:8-oxo-dGTP pyrophosphatase MutT (NUDIX family)